MFFQLVLGLVLFIVVILFCLFESWKDCKQKV